MTFEAQTIPRPRQSSFQQVSGTLYQSYQPHRRYRTVCSSRSHHARSPFICRSLVLRMCAERFEEGMWRIWCLYNTGVRGNDYGNAVLIIYCKTEQLWGGHFKVFCTSLLARHSMLDMTDFTSGKLCISGNGRAVVVVRQTQRQHKFGSGDDNMGLLSLLLSIFVLFVIIIIIIIIVIIIVIVIIIIFVAVVIIVLLSLFSSLLLLPFLSSVF